MKLISTTCAALSILIGVVAWQYTEPFLSQKGTSVIYAMTGDGKHGGKPFTTLISEELSAKQHELLNFAFDVAKTDGMKFPQYLQGILMKESRGCDMKNFRVAGLTNSIGDRYFGCGQIKLGTAKSVMNRYPEMWKYLESQTDEELQARLILDDKFNIRVASKYVLMMGINEDPTKAITSYNLGPGGAKLVDPSAHRYTQSVKQMSSSLKNVQGKSTDIKSSSRPINLVQNEYH
jgi:hypothetical protein